MLGAKIGKRVFDDGCTFTERRFVTVGDRCTLNAGAVVQCHSQEDGAFKSDRSAIGAGTTLGVGAFVHYGVDDRRRRAAPRRLVPDEGLRGAVRCPLGRQPRHGARSPPTVCSPSDTTHRPQNAIERRSCGLKEKACRSPQPTTASTGRRYSPRAAPPPCRAGSPTRPRDRRARGADPGRAAGGRRRHAAPDRPRRRAGRALRRGRRGHRLRARGRGAALAVPVVHRARHLAGAAGPHARPNASCSPTPTTR